MSDSRLAPRALYDGRVLFLNPYSLRTKGFGFLLDISGTGCRVTSQYALQEGMELALSVVASLSGRDVTVETARVLWAKGNVYGLQFLAIAPTERERLRLFLKAILGTSAPMDGGVGSGIAA